MPVATQVEPTFLIFKLVFDLSRLASKCKSTQRPAVKQGINGGTLKIPRGSICYNYSNGEPCTPTSWKVWVKNLKYEYN
jgi:hypothetical protein